MADEFFKTVGEAHEQAFAGSYGTFGAILLTAVAMDTVVIVKDRSAVFHYQRLRRTFGGAETAADAEFFIHHRARHHFFPQKLPQSHRKINTP